MSGKHFLSHSKSHQWNSCIQKQSKWNTLSGIFLFSIPSIKDVVVSSS